MIKIAVIASTGGSVLNAVLAVSYVKERVAVVLSDRECGAIDIAKKWGIASHVISTNCSLEFSNCLNSYVIENGIDIAVSFYTKLFKGGFVSQMSGRLVNLHPSILPACPGMDGFGDTIKSRSKFIGATLHLVDDGTDTGCPIIQSAIPYNPKKSLEENRHLVFISQCKMLIQYIKWYEDGRVVRLSGDDVFIKDSRFEIGEFSPNLDFESAIEFPS